MRITTLPPIPPRNPEGHKGTYGRVLLVAGSTAMPGAAILAARAALRAGAGLVTVAMPASLSSILATAVSEATQLHLSASDPKKRVEQIAAACSASSPGFNAIAVGPGLGTGPEAVATVESLLEEAKVPLVLDADAINVVAARPECAAPPSEQRVWTPHPGEFFRLTGEKPLSDSDRVSAAGKAAARLGGVMVLKGHHTAIADERRHAINRTGNPGMATGGSGDVLTGIIAALIAQGFGLFEAAHLGAYLHGLAGDLARDQLGELSITAGDLIDFLPAAIRTHQSCA